MVKDNNKKENTTKYGEFVCSTYQWLPPEEQKRQAKKLANITKNKEDKNFKK